MLVAFLSGEESRSEANRRCRCLEAQISFQTTIRQQPQKGTKRKPKKLSAASRNQRFLAANHANSRNSRDSRLKILFKKQEVTAL
jgi:hypothetical protein